MSPSLTDKVFVNADQEVVEYDGSQISWRVSAYVLIKKDAGILIIKNSREKLFDIVGGGIEIGESIEEALIREAREEAGAEIKIGRLLDTHVDWFFHRKGAFYQTLQLFYEAELVGDLKNPSDKDIAWRDFVSLDEIGKEYRLPSAVEKVINNL